MGLLGENAKVGVLLLVQSRQPLVIVVTVVAVVVVNATWNGITIGLTV